jgi:epoxyqueuosine reductase
VARYARGRDYHVVMKKRLHALADALRARFAGEEFRAFVDTAPVLEREYAARAGLGWIGRNSLLIHPRVGSYVLLGGLLTTMELEAPLEQTVVADHCGTCTRCVEACPTGAIAGGGERSVDASRCISYLTIERRLPVAEEFHRAMGDWVYGCDVCQEVCPHNSAREGPGVMVREEYAPSRRGFDLLGVLGWTEEDRRREFGGSAMKRATLAMMKRNAVIAVGNELSRRADAGLRARLEEIAADEGEEGMVRETAKVVLERAKSQIANGK